MAISKITYKQNFAYNPIQMEHIHLGVEIDLNPGEDAKKAFEEAKALVDEYYQDIIKSANVPIYEDAQVPETKVQKTPVDSMITAITSCTEVKVLETFRKLAASKPEFQKAFDNRLKELTNV